jgi:hypothetical protein
MLFAISWDLEVYRLMEVLQNLEVPFMELIGVQQQ